MAGGTVPADSPLIARRTFLAGAAAVAASAACGGGGGGSPAAASTTWSPSSISFSVGGSFDLALTLPTGTKLGGRFSVSSMGTALPPSTNLSSAGLLTASAASTVTGVVFVYEEP
jgi:hypothetical protein